MQTLSGHVSPETAYVVADYPYGFRLRCQIRFWLEFKKGHGFRFVSQTTNPKRPGTVWNTPKASVYADVLVMVLDDDGRVTYRTLSAGWSDEAAIAAFERDHAAALTDARKEAIRYCRAANAAQKYVSVTVRPVTDDEPRPSREEQADVLRRALALGYRDVAAGGT